MLQFFDGCAEVSCCLFRQWAIVVTQADDQGGFGGWICGVEVPGDDARRDCGPSRGGWTRIGVADERRVRFEFGYGHRMTYRAFW